MPATFISYHSCFLPHYILPSKTAQTITPISASQDNDQA